MNSEHDLHLTEAREYHALRAHLRMAIPAAEQLCDRFPDDRAMQRLCLYLYDALELIEREPPEEEFASPGLLIVGRNTAA